MNNADVKTYSIRCKSDCEYLCSDKSIEWVEGALPIEAVSERYIEEHYGVKIDTGARVLG